MVWLLERVSTSISAGLTLAAVGSEYLKKKWEKYKTNIGKEGFLGDILFLLVAFCGMGGAGMLGDASNTTRIETAKGPAFLYFILCILYLFGQ